MPSIEIACIGLATPLEPPATSFAVDCEAGLTSHRSPKPLFQADFDGLSGSLYHLGNPGREEGTAFFAYELLSEASRDVDPSFLEFAREHLHSAHVLLAWLLDTSPEGQLLFTSDWQGGPDSSHRFPAVTLSGFWDLHDSRKLLLNSAYLIQKAV